MDSTLASIRCTCRSLGHDINEHILPSICQSSVMNAPTVQSSRRTNDFIVSIQPPKQRFGSGPSAQFPGAIPPSSITGMGSTKCACRTQKGRYCQQREQLLSRTESRRLKWGVVSAARPQVGGTHRLPGDAMRVRALSKGHALAGPRPLGVVVVNICA